MLFPELYRFTFRRNRFLRRNPRDDHCSGTYRLRNSCRQSFLSSRPFSRPSPWRLPCPIALLRSWCLLSPVVQKNKNTDQTKNQYCQNCRTSENMEQMFGKKQY